MSCAHDHRFEHRFLLDRTPMIAVYCPDCGYSDYGHVYADPETWLDEDEL